MVSVTLSPVFTKLTLRYAYLCPNQVGMTEYPTNVSFLVFIWKIPRFNSAILTRILVFQKDRANLFKLVISRVETLPVSW